MAQIFVSYSRKDSQFVDILTQALGRMGYSAWMDRKDIGAGDIWTTDLGEGLDQCPVYVIVLSPQAVVSPNVKRELALAFEKNKPIIPVRYQPFTRPPDMDFALVGKQWIDFHEQPFDQSIQQLAQAIRAKLGNATLKYWQTLMSPPQPPQEPKSYSLADVIMGEWQAQMRDADGDWQLEIRFYPQWQFGGNKISQPQGIPWMITGTWQVEPPSKLVLNGQQSGIGGFPPMPTSLRFSVSFTFTHITEKVLQGVLLPDLTPCVWRKYG